MSALLAILITSLLASAPLDSYETQVYRYTGFKGYERETVGHVTFDMNAGRHCGDLLEVLVFADDSIIFNHLDVLEFERVQTEASNQIIEMVNEKKVELHSEGQSFDGDSTLEWKYTCRYSRIL